MCVASIEIMCEDVSAFADEEGEVGGERRRPVRLSFRTGDADEQRGHHEFQVQPPLEVDFFPRPSPPPFHDADGDARDGGAELLRDVGHGGGEVGDGGSGGGGGGGGGGEGEGAEEDSEGEDRRDLAHCLSLFALLKEASGTRVNARLRGERKRER